MVSSKNFTWVPEERAFVADMSDMPQGTFCRAYPDAADEGLLLVSVKTGAEVMYVENHQARDAEGELKYVEYVPTKDAARRVPGCRGTRVLLFND